jgi:hypothetical protein
MRVASPAALWLLVLCLLPLLLSRRRPTVRHVVSNAYLWRDAVHPTTGRIAPRRRRRTLLMLVQMAAIAAMVLAHAGLVVSGGGGRIAIVFDVSASMAARDGETIRIDGARARVRSILETLPRLARVRLILAAASPRQAGEWAASDPRLAGALEALEPTAGTADVSGAIERAASAGDVDAIIVVSDRDVSSAPGTSGRPALQLVDVGGTAENAAVTRVAVRRTELGGTAGQILVALRNYGRTAREAVLEIDIDGRPVHRAPLRLRPAGSQTVNVAVDALGQFITARLAGGDALTIDDSRSIAVPPARAIRVALIGPGGSFLEHALAVHPSVSLRTFDQRTPPPDVAVTAQFDVLVCDRCSDPQSSEIPSLVVSDTPGDRSRDAVRVVATNHALADSLEPGDVAATVSAAIRPDPRGEVVLRVGRAAAVTAVDGPGPRRVDVHLDLTEPDFALSTAFPVLVANAVAWLTAPLIVPPEATAGEPLVFAGPPRAGDEVRVTGPDGRPREVQRAGGRFVVAGTDSAGQYRIQANGLEHLVAINPNVLAESDLSTPRAAALDRAEAAPASPGAPIAAPPSLALLALALLGAEWWLRMQGA